jgi:hypothetical protein
MGRIRRRDARSRRSASLSWLTRGWSFPPGPAALFGGLIRFTRCQRS